MASPFIPAEADTALGVLKEIFGPAISHITNSTVSSSETMLGVAFGFFNSGVMFFACLLLTGITIFGIANTANDGAALGKRWSTLYTPLRTLTAGSLLIPTSSGFCGIQILILTMVVWSIGFASQLWEKCVDFVLTDNIVESVMQSVQDDRSYNTLASQAILLQLCSHAVEKSYAAFSPDGSQPHLTLKRDTTGRIEEKTTDYGVISKYTTRYYYGDRDEAQTQRYSDIGELCGSVNYTKSYYKPSSSSTSTTSGSSTLVDLLKATISPKVAAVTTKISDIKYKYVDEMFSDGGYGSQLAAKIVTTIDTKNERIDPVYYHTLIEERRQMMLQEIRAAVKNGIQSDLSGIRDKLAGNGWAWAGAAHMEIARIKDTIRNTTNINTDFFANTSSASIGKNLQGAVKDAVEEIGTPYLSAATALGIELNKQESSAATSGTQHQSTVPALPSVAVDDWKLSPREVSSSGLNSMFGISTWAVQYFTTWTNYKGSDGTYKDPLLRIKDLGDYMLGLGEFGVALNAALQGPGAGILKTLETSVVPGTSALAGVVAGAIKSYALYWEAYGVPACSALIIGGHFMGLWLPTLPFYIFFLGFVGWVLVVIEAVAAAPMFAAMHLTPESNDSFIGSQMQGYLLLMSVFFRPPLMILGFVASLVTLPPIMDLLNTMFGPMFWSTQGNSITGLGRLTGMIVIYATVVTSVITLIMALPQSMPDRILRWIGAGIGDMGEQNSMSEIKHGASHMARGALTGAESGGRAYGAAKRADDQSQRAGEASALQAQKDEQRHSDLMSALSASPVGHGGQGAVSPLGGDKPI